MTLTFPAIHTSFTTIGLIEFPVQFATCLVILRLILRSTGIYGRHLWALFFSLAGMNLLVYLAITKGHVGQAVGVPFIVLLFIAWYIAPAIYLRKRNYAFGKVTLKSPKYAWWIIYTASYTEFALYSTALSIHGRYADAAMICMALGCFAYVFLLSACSGPPPKLPNIKGARV